jgi:hypothetical protein
VADNAARVHAGDLRERVRFERRGLDANGDALGPFAELFTRAASIIYMRGSETVMAQRLEGQQPVIVTVVNSRQIREVTTADRLVNARDGTVYDIKAVPRDPRPLLVELLAVNKVGGTPG